MTECKHRRVEYFPDEWVDYWRCTDCGVEFGPTVERAYEMIDALRLSYDDNMCWRKRCEELQSRLALVEQANRDANALIGAEADARAEAEKELREQLAAAEEKLTELRYARDTAALEPRLLRALERW